MKPSEARIEVLNRALSPFNFVIKRKSKHYYTILKNGKVYKDNLTRKELLFWFEGFMVAVKEHGEIIKASTVKYNKLINDIENMIEKHKEYLNEIKLLKKALSGELKKSKHLPIDGEATKRLRKFIEDYGTKDLEFAKEFIALQIGTKRIVVLSDEGEV